MFGLEIQNLISNLGWALIHFIWQGTLITLAYWVITRNISSIHTKYWTGMGMVVLALLAPILNTLSFSNQSESLVTLVTLQSGYIAHQQLSIENLALYLINKSLPLMVLIWASTVLFLSIRLIRSWMQLAAIKHDCEPIVSKELKGFIKNVAIKLDLPNIPMLKVSKQVLVPAAYGIFKPTVLLPLSLISKIPREQLEAIIKHELCHLKRNDFVHNIIQLCADTLLFFHPGIRWMNNDIRHIREQCCDQLVLSNDTETITYAKALTSIAEFTNGLKLKHSIHLGINDGVLLNRVKFLLQNKSSQSSLMIFAPLFLIIIFSIILLQPRTSNLNDNVLTKNSSQNSEQSLFNEQNRTAKNKSFSLNHIFYPRIIDNDVKQKDPFTTTVIASAINYELMAKTTKIIEENQNDVVIIEDLTQHIPSSIQDTSDIALNDFSFNQTNLFSENVSTIDSADELLITDEESINVENSPLGVDTQQVTQSNLQELSSFTNSESITPEFKRYVAPEYPQHFWYNQIEQDVIATFKINSDGKAYDINFSAQDKNFFAFEREVEKAMKSWRFDTASLNSSTLQRTYQQIFSFALSETLEKNCQQARTGSRLAKPMPCNK